MNHEEEVYLEICKVYPEPSASEVFQLYEITLSQYGLKVAQDWLEAVMHVEVRQIG